MLFGASRHMVLLITIRSPIMTDAVRCIPVGASRHVLLLITIRSPIMTDVVQCIPTRGITYYNSVSHHDRCCLAHPDTWYQLNVIRHQDGCRLVHPVKWDISSMPYTIMTDADWCIPPSGTSKNFGVPT